MLATYKAAAKRLRMTMSPAETSVFTREVMLRGELQGEEVLIRRSLGARERVSRALLRQPGDLGLMVTRAGVLHDLAGFFGAKDVQLGDPRADAALRIVADEPTRAAALLVPTIREALVALIAVKMDVMVCDSIVEISTYVGQSTEESVEEIEEEGRIAAALATKISAAMEAVPPAAALREHEAAWRAYALAHDLAFSPMPLAMQGQIGGAEVTVRIARTGKVTYASELVVRLAAPLGVGLEVRTQATRGLFSGLLDGEGEQTGDATFDALFWVTAARPAVIPDVLRRPVRDALRGLRGAAEDVTLSDERLTVLYANLLAPDDLLASVERAAEVANLLFDATRGGGAYR